MAQNNRVSLRIGPGTATGALTDPIYFKGVCHTGTTITPNVLTQDSEKICGNQGDSRGRDNPARLGFNPTGGWNGELEWGQIDNFAEGLFQNAWDAQNARTNEYNAAQITAVSSSAYTVTTGTAFAQNQIIRAWGFTNEANNRVFVAQSGSGATSVTVTGGATESSPPATANLRVVGLRFGAGTAATNGTAKTLTISGHTLTNYISVGDWIYIGGYAAEDKFATAASNGWCRVSAVTSTVATFDIVPAGFATDNGTGKTIHIWVGDWLSDASTKKAYPIETEYVADVDGDEFYSYTPSWYPNSLNLTIENSDTARIVNFSVEGFSIAEPLEQDARTANATTFGPADFDSIHSGDDIASVMVGGALLPGTELTTGLTMNISNNLTRKGAVGYNAGFDVNGGTFSVTGDLTIYHDSNTFSSMALAGDRFDLNWVAVDNEYFGMIFDMPNCEFTDTRPDNAQRDQATRNTLPYSAYYDQTLGCVARFGSFAAVAAPVTVDS